MAGRLHRAPGAGFLDGTGLSGILNDFLILELFLLDNVYSDLPQGNALIDHMHFKKICS